MTKAASKQLHTVKKRTLSHDVKDNLILTNFAIDFKQVALMKLKVTKSFPNEEAMRKSVESLIDLFVTEYEQSSKELGYTLMIWRGILILLQFEQLLEWDWTPVMTSILKCLFTTYPEMR